jgi:hypothetical protein
MGRIEAALAARGKVLKAMCDTGFQPVKHGLKTRATCFTTDC